MKPILLEHPRHGRKWALMDGELQYDLKHGWLPVKVEEKPEVQPEVPKKRGPGRPRKAS